MSLKLFKSNINKTVIVLVDFSYSVEVKFI